MFWCWSYWRLQQPDWRLRQPVSDCRIPELVLLVHLDFSVSLFNVWWASRLFPVSHSICFVFSSLSSFNVVSYQSYIEYVSSRQVTDVLTVFKEQMLTIVTVVLIALTVDLPVLLRVLDTFLQLSSLWNHHFVIRLTYCVIGPYTFLSFKPRVHGLISSQLHQLHLYEPYKLQIHLPIAQDIVVRVLMGSAETSTNLITI